MDQQRIEAYLNLIQQLLSCPSGEEPQVLNNSLELVDEGFVLACQQVAAQLQEAGQENNAAFLQDLAQQLAQFLGGQADGGETQPKATEEEYQSFLMELLQLKNEGNNRNVIYPFLAQHQDKLDPTFAEMLVRWFQSEKNQKSARLLNNLAIDMWQFPLGSRANNLEVAIACYQAALEVRTREAFPEQWAMTQNNLGNAYSNRIKGERGDNLEVAIACYQAALEVRTREAFPEKWAMTQNNLGNAYLYRIKGERGDNLEVAIACYQAALEVYTREAFPEKWAMTQNNLGNAYLYRIKGERGDNLEVAIACYQAALEVRTREAFPEDWAMTQNNLAAAYLYRIKGERGDNLEVAIACYQAALEVYTREAFPEQWATTQNNLAVAYNYRIKGERGDNIEVAIACYQAALEVTTREAFPEQWAMTQNNLAIAYSDRIKGERGDNLEVAIACYQAALEVYTREAFPQYWAMTQNNLAVAYLYRIKGERGDNLEVAIACYQAALEVRTREAFPEKWAETQNNLATAYNDRIKGERGDNLEVAIACYQAALEVYTREAFPEYWAQTQNNLGNAYSNRIKGERGDNLEVAIACCQAALEVYTREAFPQNHAGTLFNLGLAYRDAAQLENARSSFARAIDTVEEIRSGIVLGGEADRQKLAAKWNKLYVNMVEVCLELEDFAGALESAERGKARNLVELFAASRLKPEGVAPEVWERYKDLDERWRNLQQQGDGTSSLSGDPSPKGDSRSLGLSSPTPGTATADISQDFASLRRQIDDFIKTNITPHDPKFRFGQQVQPIPYSEIQALAQEGTAIVEWYFTSNRIQAFIVTGQGQQPIVVSTEGGALAALEELTDEYKNDYLKDSTHWRQELPSRLQRLAEILELDKLISQIPSGCRQLVLVPYRYLHLFPLHGLPVSQTSQKPGFLKKPGFLEPSTKPGFLEPSKKPGFLEPSTTLGDLFSEGIRYVPSSQILQLSLLEDSPTEGESFFGIQNPTADLAYTDLEVEAIQTAFNPATVLQGETASKTGFNQAVATLKQTGFAHFSCHGYFNFANPRISGLILADALLPATASTKPDSPRIRTRRGDFDAEKCLTLPEIFNLRLPRCRLVALSACETGITDITTTSDEYISLTAGFFFAGSRNVLGTLWAVDDVSTAIFMIRFYETLLGQTQPPVALALKETQNWMRGVTVAELLQWVGGCKLVKEERRQEICDELDEWYDSDEIPFSSPYHWAGFCAVGQ